MSADKRYILDEQTISKKLDRLALEVVENNLEEQEIVFVGIAENGMVLANAIQQRVAAITPIRTSCISLSLDKLQPDEIILSEEMDFDGKTVIVVDDVKNSGKALLYALKPFLAYHPKKIQTLVLIERTHTQYPVSANYKGLSLATTLQEHIYVAIKGQDIVGAYLD